MENPSSLILQHVFGKDQSLKQGNACVFDLKKKKVGRDFITHL